MGTSIALVLVFCGGGAYLAHMGGWPGLAGALLCTFGGFGFGHEALKASLERAGYRVQVKDKVWRVGRVKPVTADPVEWL